MKNSRLLLVGAVLLLCFAPGLSEASQWWETLQNEITNPGFEGGSTNYLPNSWTTISNDLSHMPITTPSTHHSGTYSDGKSGYPMGVIYQDFKNLYFDPTLHNKQWNFSMWANVDDGPYTDNQAIVELYYWDKDPSLGGAASTLFYSNTVDDTCGWEKFCASGILPVQPEWFRVQVKFNPLQTHNFGDCGIWVDDFDFRSKCVPIPDASSLLLGFTGLSGLVGLGKFRKR